MATILSHTSKFRYMTSFLKLVFVITTLTIVSCGQEKKEPSKEKWEVRYDKQKQLDNINLTDAEKLSKSSNANIGWNTTNNFTYSLQELFESDPRPVSFIGEIKDIIKKDSTSLALRCY